MNNLFLSCMMINYTADRFRGESSVDSSHTMLERYETFRHFELVMKIRPLNLSTWIS